MTQISDMQTDSDTIKKEKNELVISYLSLRKYLGVLGMALPIILLVGSIVANNGSLERAVSDYFHTPLRQFFTISLGGISLLLFAYRGYDHVDKWITNAAGVFGLLTAFVCTRFKADTHLYGYAVTAWRDRDKYIPLKEIVGDGYEIVPPQVGDLQATLHLVFASTFFILLAYMAMFQFTKAGKFREKLTYRICGGAMFLAIAGMLPIAFDSEKIQQFYSDYKLVFWGEFICLWAFGISWLVKGISSEQRVLKRRAKQAKAVQAQIIQQQ